VAAGDHFFPVSYEEETVRLIAEMLHGWWSSEQVHE
jgi:hypothetical protein